MTLIISNDVITLGTCFSRSFPPRADWQKSDSSVEGEPQGIGGGIQTSSRDVVASSPSFSCPAARAPRRACPVLVSNGLQYVIFISLGSTSEQLKVKNRTMAKPWALYNDVFLYTFEVQIEVSMKGSSLQIHWMEIYKIKSYFHVHCLLFADNFRTFFVIIPG